MNSFLYVDEYKMYSISAQIFGGLTESIVEYSQRSKSDHEQQKGPFASGRLLADIASEQAGTHERKYLHDYAYTLFEKKLLAEKKLLELDRELTNSFREEIKSTSLIKVTGRALFTDVPLLTELMSKFNDFGEALTYVTKSGEIKQLKDSLEERLAQISDPKEKAELRRNVKSLGDIKTVAKELGLQQDSTYLKHLTFLINFMMKDFFELRISLPSTTGNEINFSSLLKPESLREPRDTILRKYSRRCEEPLTIVGIVTQGRRDRIIPEDESEGAKIEGAKNLREALLGLGGVTSTLEESFFGRMDNEYVLDPIAVFRQL